MLRRFTDNEGVRWRVWDVNPHVNAESRPYIPSRVAAKALPGWLCFESAVERRRLSPIPTGWETRSEQELAAFCSTAQVVPRLARELNETSAGSELPKLI